MSTPKLESIIRQKRELGDKSERGKNVAEVPGCGVFSDIYMVRTFAPACTIQIRDQRGCVAHFTTRGNFSAVTAGLGLAPMCWIWCPLVRKFAYATAAGSFGFFCGSNSGLLGGNVHFWVPVFLGLGWTVTMPVVGVPQWRESATSGTTVLLSPIVRFRCIVLAIVSPIIVHGGTVVPVLVRGREFD